jgi:hypothetical protein
MHARAITRLVLDGLIGWLHWDPGSRGRVNHEYTNNTNVNARRMQAEELHCLT